MKNIYLDIDGVLADFVGHFFKYLDLPDHPPTEWDDPRIRTHFHRIAYDKEFWLTIPPLVQELPFKPFGYITTRPILNEVSVFWLGKHGFPYAPCFTTEHGVKKNAYMLDNSLLIDDAVHNYHDVISGGHSCLLLDTPYNRHIDTEHRIYSLNEVQERLLAAV